MNCFQLIKTVLDEAYAAMPGKEAAKDAAIQAELNQLSQAYSGSRRRRNFPRARDPELAALRRPRPSDYLILATVLSPSDRRVIISLCAV
jgi:hypothetical protein